jgi:hypothetical protein
MWRDNTKYSKAEDWVFASRAARGQRPYWGQCLMRTIIRPAAAKVGITQHIGWHTFRHTYAMRPAGSRSTPIHRQLRHRSDEPKAASFVFCRRPQRLQVEMGQPGICSYFVPARTGAISARNWLFNELHSF